MVVTRQPKGLKMLAKVGDPVVFDRIKVAPNAKGMAG
jgi:hypothetical protein